PTGQPLEVIGWLIRGSRRYARVAGEIRLADGTVTARCEATVIRPSGEFQQMWQDAEGEYWKVYDD
ncbi:hypothetical protein, partial [Syntrophomonas wolfei]